MLQILDAPVRASVRRDLGCRQMGAAGDHHDDFLAAGRSGQVGDVAADDGQARGVGQAEAVIDGGGPGGPPVDAPVAAFDGRVRW